MVYETVSPLDRPTGAGVNRRWMLVLGAAVLVCAAYVAGRNSRPFAVLGMRPRPVLYYVDPMHPAYRSEKPGKAPDCGMDLEPVYAGGVPAQAVEMSPGSVRLTPDQEQAIRLQTEQVQAAPAVHGLQTVGRVAPDEARTYRVRPVRMAGSAACFRTGPEPR
jgi:hypothetical protein